MKNKQTEVRTTREKYQGQDLVRKFPSTLQVLGSTRIQLHSKVYSFITAIVKDFTRQSSFLAKEMGQGYGRLE